MKREELGERLQQWHSSSGDPVYAVGSFYFAGHKYPRKDIVENAVNSLTTDLNQFKRMLNGETVSVYNKTLRQQISDLRHFAGYTDNELREHIKDLEEIIPELTRFMMEDYG